MGAVLKKILRNYQMGAVRYLRKHNGGALFIDMRLGKTVCVVRFLQMRANVHRVLVVAPYSAFDGWQKERPDITDISINAEVSNWQTQPGWYIINKEAHLHTHILENQWDAIVLDESFIQNPKAKVTKYFLKYRNQIPIRILLSGTPAPESELQYYTQLAFLFPGVFNVKNYWEYRARYARPDFQGYNWQLRPEGQKILAKVLAQKCFFLKCEDVALYPLSCYIKRMIKLTDMKLYKKAERNCLDDIDRILKYAGQRWNYLRRLCSQGDKVKELLYLLRGELRGKQVVIWCDFVEEVERLASILRCPYIHGGVSHEKRKQIIYDFNNAPGGNFLYIVVQPETMKFGSDLGAADTEIYFSSPQGLMSRLQSEKRIINLKRKYPILIIDLIAEDTIEEDIIDSLEHKESKQQQLERIRNGILRRNN